MNLNEFISQAKRIFILSKKPSRQEFTVMLKITGIGILVIGVIAYILTLLMQLSGIGH
ncbi:MAG TPA: protein translocase SEC61 complex subunit gamma [archaeon]|nr:protein translocase SEC61 complex subunit gamma [archaeon]